MAYKTKESKVFKITEKQILHILSGIAEAAVSKYGYTELGRREFLRICAVMDGTHSLGSQYKREWQTAVSGSLTEFENYIKTKQGGLF